MTYPAQYKRLKNKPWTLYKLKKLYNDCIYSFTKRKGETLWKDTLFQLIFIAFIKSDDFKLFLTKDSTLSKNKNEVKVAVTWIMNSN